MLTLPAEYIMILATLAPVFFWEGLAPGTSFASWNDPGSWATYSHCRTADYGAEHGKAFSELSRVLNRAVWSSREASRLFLGMLIATFTVTGPVVMGLDDTIERRRGATIKAKGIYRDPVRSSHIHFVKAIGLW